MPRATRGIFSLGDQFNSYTSHSLPFLPTYPRQSLTSACHLMSIYVLCSVYGNKNEFTLYTIFTELYNSTGYEDVTLCTINIKEHTILPHSPYIYPHVQSQSSRALPWPSPPACCGLVHLPITTSLLLPPNSSPAGAIHQQLRNLELHARNDDEHRLIHQSQKQTERR